MTTNPAENPAYVAQTLCSMLIQNCPKKELNLVDTIGFDIDNATGLWTVFIGGDALLEYAKAPYAGYTNEPHKDVILHYRKVYPGQELTGWINKTIEQCCRLLEAY